MADFNYLITVAVPAHPISEDKFAIESAFAEHLHLLRERLGPLAGTMVIAAPQMTPEAYERAKSHLAVIDFDQDSIRLTPLFPDDLGRLGYMRALPRILVRLLREVRQADIVHTGPSTLYRMFEFPAFLMGALMGKVTVATSDIDERKSPIMNLKSGRWGRRQYWTNKLLHQPISHLQHSIIARFGSLVLYKGAALARDFGKGRSNVKCHLDAAFSAVDIITPEELAAKRSLITREITREDTGIRICYFGRLVAYKGVDHMLRAVAHARQLGLDNLTFEIFGDGEDRASLENLAGELGLSDVTQFHGALPFGRDFLRRLRQHHVLLAAPLSEDTPRSALDAMASGQAILAYDTYYYRDLANAGAGVEVVPWFEPEALGLRLFQITQDRNHLARLFERSVTFANENTQEIWLDRRAQWTREAVIAKWGAAPGAQRLQDA